jgi:hypothetical protein
MNIKAFQLFCKTTTIRPGDSDFKSRLGAYMRHHFRTVDHWDHEPIYPTTLYEKLRYVHVRLKSMEDITERIEEQIDDMEADYEHWLREYHPSPCLSSFSEKVVKHGNPSRLLHVIEE